MRKTLLRTIAIAALSVLGTAATFPSTDTTIQLKDAKGTVVATTKVAADGSFHFDAVPPGQFVLEMVVDGKAVASPPGAGPQFTFEVRAAREASTGLATGKRQHPPPIKFTKEYGRSGQVTGTVDGQTVAGMVINNSHSNIKTP